MPLDDHHGPGLIIQSFLQLPAFSFENWTKATLGQENIWMGDFLGAPGAAGRCFDALFAYGWVDSFESWSYE